MSRIPMTVRPTFAVRTRHAVCALLMLLGSTTAMRGQYFGQNKVQYDRFDFQVIRTEHFDIYHYPEEAEPVRLAARLAAGRDVQRAKRY